MATNRTTKGDLDIEDEGAKAFSFTLLEAENGDFARDLTSEQFKVLRELREQAALRGKAKGEIAVLFKYEVDETDAVTITTSYKTKLPPPPRKKSIKWLSKGGNLIGVNPKQLELGVRAVPEPNKRDVPDEKRREAEV